MTRRLVHGISSRLSLLPILLMFAALSLGLAACDNTSSTPTPIGPIQPTAAPTVGTADALKQLTSTQSITMRDDWAGLSKASPIRAHYTLSRLPDGAMTGLADFAAGEQSGVAITATETITIPAAVVSDFLDRLAAIPLKAGDYVPNSEHTDDYPNIAITIQLSAGTASYYTQSQGDNHVPWAINIANETYVVDSTEIADAYALLTPYLKKDVLDQVVGEATNR